MAAFLNGEGATQTRSVFVPKIDLPPDHRLLMQAIMALAETDYRRASIDAGTASEVALASAIHEELTSKGLNPEFIDRTIRTANGLDGLCLRCICHSAMLCQYRQETLELTSPVSGMTAAHAGRVPSPEEATRAVELAHALVTAAHPFAH